MSKLWYSATYNSYAFEIFVTGKMFAINISEQVYLYKISTFRMQTFLVRQYLVFSP